MYLYSWLWCEGGSAVMCTFGYPLLADPCPPPLLDIDIEADEDADEADDADDDVGTIAVVENMVPPTVPMAALPPFIPEAGSNKP